MTVTQTRCPFCHSAFYITALQLNAYRGQARCGQCHQIFDAKTNMAISSNFQENEVETASEAAEPVSVAAPATPPEISETPTESPVEQKQLEPTQPRIRAAHHVSYAVPTRPAHTGRIGDIKSATSAAVTTASSSKEPIFADGAQFDDQSAAALDKHVEQRISAESNLPEPISNLPPPHSTIIDSPIEPLSKPIVIPTAVPPSKSLPVSEMAQPKTNAVDEEQLLFSDDAGLFDDDEPAVPDTKQSSPLLGDSFHQNFLDDTFEEIDVLKQQELSEVEKLHAGADDSWINDLLKEEKKPVVNIEPDLKPIVVTPAPTTYTPLPDSMLQRPPVDHDEDLLSFLNRTGAVIMPSAAARPNSSTSNTTAPRPASHRILKPTTVRYNPFYFIGWGLMSLLMLGLLIGQYIYFNFEHLAMEPKTSAYISRLCNITGCQIPYMNEDELHIKKVKLVANNRLGKTTFQAQLSNSARLSQPFPALRLSLKRDGKTVASQIIQPRQYLPDNLKTLTRLATKTPYPVEFTIKTHRADIQSFSLEPQYH
ncbi:MAG: DUF3426 domain-containing protein [Moraxellaceae bacterium]|nr:MAG: DUF3426 domain-containing protein [Moraxellaceae bacterium]